VDLEIISGGFPKILKRNDGGFSGVSGDFLSGIGNGLAAKCGGMGRELGSDEWAETLKNWG